MEDALVWIDGNCENFIVKKEGLDEWLDEQIKEIQKCENGNYEDYNYERQINGYIKNNAKRIKDDLIGLHIHVMSSWFVINQELVEKYRKGELEQYE